MRGVSLQGSQWSTPTTIGEFSGFFGKANITIDDQGHGYAIWHDVDIIVSEFDGTWQPHEKLYDDSNLWYPHAAGNDAGDVAVVWWRDSIGGAKRNGWQAILDQSTGTWNADLLEFDDYDHCQNPQVGIDRDGNIIAVWKQHKFDFTQSGIYFRLYDAAANTWSAERLIANTASSWSHSLAVNANKQAMLIVRQDGLAGAPDSLEAFRFDPSTELWTLSGPVETEAVNTVAVPDLVLHDNGDAIVTWGQTGDNGFWQTWANRYDATNDQWGTAQRLEPDSGGGVNIIDGPPKVAVSHSTGAAFVAWSQWIEDAYRVRACRMDPVTFEWGPAEFLDEAGIGHSEEVDITSAENGAMVIWSYGFDHPVAVNRFVE